MKSRRSVFVRRPPAVKAVLAFEQLESRDVCAAVVEVNWWDPWNGEPLADAVETVWWDDTWSAEQTAVGSSDAAWWESYDWWGAGADTSNDGTVAGDGWDGSGSPAGDDSAADIPSMADESAWWFDVGGSGSGPGDQGDVPSIADDGHLDGDGGGSPEPEPPRACPDAPGIDGQAEVFDADPADSLMPTSAGDPTAAWAGQNGSDGADTVPNDTVDTGPAGEPVQAEFAGGNDGWPTGPLDAATSSAADGVQSGQADEPADTSFADDAAEAVAARAEPAAAGDAFEAGPTVSGLEMAGSGSADAANVSGRPASDPETLVRSLNAAAISPLPVPVSGPVSARPPQDAAPLHGPVVLSPRSPEPIRRAERLSVDVRHSQPRGGAAADLAGDAAVESPRASGLSASIFARVLGGLRGDRRRSS